MNYSKLPYQAAAFCLTSSFAMGVNVDWDGDSDLDFNNASNWDGDVLPGTGDRARYFAVQPGGTVTLSADITVGRIQAGASFTDQAVDVTIDTSGSTLNLTSVSNTVRAESTTTPSSFTLIGDFTVGDGTSFSQPGIVADAPSSITFSSATLTGDSGVNLIIHAEGAVTLSDSIIVSPQGVSVLEGPVGFDGANSVTSDITLGSGGGLSFTPGGEVAVTGDIDGTGNWVFDLAGQSGSTPTYIDAETIDITNISLDVSNMSGTDTIVLAEYDSLVGSQFASVSGLGGRSVDYNYQGSGLIAIVPEPSWTVPVLAAFLPLFGLRRRMK